MQSFIIRQIRERMPLVHCITNYVTVNDVANVLLAVGARPIMADDPAEAAEITALCAGLCLNIGTLNERTIPSMLAAGKAARALGRPVVLDPVGAGASRLRTETALRIMDEVHPAAVRGNISEIRTLAAGSGRTQGVDAAASSPHFSRRRSQRPRPMPSPPLQRPRPSWASRGSRHGRTWQRMRAMHPTVRTSSTPSTA